MTCAMIRYPILQVVDYVLGFHPSAQSPSNLLSSAVKQPLEFFFTNPHFLAAEILFSRALIPAIKKTQLSVNFAAFRPITPVFVLRVDR